MTRWSWVLIVDELGRASRDMIETLMLGRIMEKLNKRLMGATDGFDTNNPLWKPMLSIFGALQEWFVDHLRSKVNRGMDYAFEMGSNTGVPAFGYKLVQYTDDQGNPIFGSDGEPLNALAVDKKPARYVRLVFRLSGLRLLSLDQIATLLNRFEINGTKCDAHRVKKLLTRWKYVGILTFRMTYREKNDEDKYVTKYRPRSEWKVKRASSPDRVEKAVETRSKASEEMCSRLLEESRSGGNTHGGVSQAACPTNLRDL